MSQRTLWRLSYTSVFILSVLTFTPLVIPIGQHEPMVFGIPYTLWTGVLVTIGLVGLTYMATRVYPPDGET